MRDLILDKSLELFNTQGYTEVGMRQIARELDISPGNLTYYFNKKEDILFELLEQFKDKNSQFYEHYLHSKPDLFNFLCLMKNILSSQYQYRGVYIGNQVVQSELQQNDRFNYRTVAAQRLETFRKMFEALRNACQLEASNDDITFLVSFISLFGRFWISEATLFNNTPDKMETIEYYLLLLAKELSLFATPPGKKMIDEFCIELSECQFSG